MRRDGTRRFELPVLYLTTFVDTIGFGVAIPVLPFYALSLHASPFQMALMTTMFNFGSLFGNMILCSLSDRFGRKLVLCTCLFATSVCNSCLVFVRCAPELIALRFFAGFFGGTVAVAKTYVADCTTVEERAQCLANVNAALASSIVFGPGLGGLCALVSLSFAFQAMAVLSLVNTIAAVMLLEGAPSHTPQGDRYSGSSAKVGVLVAIQAEPMILVVIASSGLQYAAYAPFESLGAVLMVKQYHIGTSIFASVTAAGGVVYFLTMKIAFLQTYNRIDGRRTAQLGHLFRGMGYVALAVGSDVWMAVFSQLCFGLGGFITPANDTTLSLMSDASSRGAVQGLSAAVCACARAVVPLAAAPVFEVNHRLPFVLSACLTGLSTVMLCFLQDPQPRLAKYPEGFDDQARNPLESLPAADPSSTNPASRKSARNGASTGERVHNVLIEPLMASRCDCSP
eukprot:TRINITY_DN68611_c0_g1_i1.p1 TRINITY_DN68611_c0_g1~~TRINITY_DN68611_c0_g1_i1.p1  ORF type:complete len:455 (-),score=53.47 TRINITY_DN68611_c0_g1_i1:32-1396(-)